MRVSVIEVLRKVLGGAIGIAPIGFVALAVFDFYRGGYFSVPDLPVGALTVSYKNGFRAVVLEADVTDPKFANGPKWFRRLNLANPDRRYFGVPFEVSPFLEDSWSWCEKPTKEERVGYAQVVPSDWKNYLDTARLDAVCRLDVDGEKINRGLIYSVPRL